MFYVLGLEQKRACSYSLQAQSITLRSRQRTACVGCYLFVTLRIEFEAAVDAQAIVGLCLFVTIFALHMFVYGRKTRALTK